MILAGDEEWPEANVNSATSFPNGRCKASAAPYPLKHVAHGGGEDELWNRWECERHLTLIPVLNPYLGTERVMKTVAYGDFNAMKDSEERFGILHLLLIELRTRSSVAPDTITLCPVRPKDGKVWGMVPVSFVYRRN